MLSINCIFFKEYPYRFFPNLYHSDAVFTYSPSSCKTLVAFSNVVCLKLSSSNSNTVFTYSSSSPKTLVAFSDAICLKLSSFVILLRESTTNVSKSVSLI